MNRGYGTHLIAASRKRSRLLKQLPMSCRLPLVALCFVVFAAIASLQAQVAISISPTSASVPAGTAKQFSATVTGTTNTSVKWYVDGVLGGSASTGTITTGGLYTAPSTTGSHTVRATSNADPTKSASSAVTVIIVTISINPTSVSVPINTTKQFAASVTGTTNTSVKWYVDNIVGGSSTSGTITTGGYYTAPATAGSHTVKITSNADPSKSSSSAVTVTNTVVGVSISPTSATVAANTTKQFTATITGTTNQGMQWAVDGVTGGNSTVGTISTGGLYTAPATAGSHTVKITSNADPTKSASAAVTVNTPGIAVSISPTSASVIANATKQFTATVTGTTNTTVQWSVDGVAGGNSTAGTISTSGLYTAPAVAGSHTVTATSNADSTKSANATVTVPAVAVSISPTSASIPLSTTKQFTATVTGTTNTAVQWSVDGIDGGDSIVGTVSTSGLYTAPSTAGSHSVRATSIADSSKSASAAVTVTAVSVSISPTTVSVTANTTKQFAATVTGTTNTNVTWSVDGVVGGSSTSGTISTSGRYTAPATAGSHTVTTTSNADPTKSASSAVTVTEVGISVSPTSASIAVSTTQQFSATVTGTTNTAVQWSVDGVAGGNSTAGTVSTSGLYTAPATEGPHTVTATSSADTTKTASAAVTVTPPAIAVSITPTSATVTATTTKQFTATVTNTADTGVQWSVDGIDGGNPSVGRIATDGLYTAPSNPGSHTVTATSNADPTKTASAAVTVPEVGVSVSPNLASITLSATKQFTATVTGSTDTGVHWSVDGLDGGDSTAGTISTGGLYTAPSTAGSHTVTATSDADSSKTGSAAVTVGSAQDGTPNFFGLVIKSALDSPWPVIAQAPTPAWTGGVLRLHDAKVKLYDIFNGALSGSTCDPLGATPDVSGCNWTAFDQFAADALNHGVTMEYTFSRMPTSPYWSSYFPYTSSSPNGTAGDAAFVAMVKAIRDREGCSPTRQTGCISLWEIWNEPNNDAGTATTTNGGKPYWTGTSSTGGSGHLPELVHLARLIHEHVRTPDNGGVDGVDPNALVIGPAAALQSSGITITTTGTVCAPTWGNSNLNPEVYICLFLQTTGSGAGEGKGKDYIDAVSAHLYPATSDLTIIAEQPYTKRLAGIKTAIGLNGLQVCDYGSSGSGCKMLINSEYSWGTCSSPSTPRIGPSGCAVQVSGSGQSGSWADDQAAFIAKTYHLGRYYGLAGQYWYGWDFNNGYGTLLCTAENLTIGCVNGPYPYQLKAAWAYGAIQWMTGKTQTGCSNSGATWVCNYIGQQGYSATVLWNSAQNGVAQTFTGVTQTRDMYGNVTPAPDGTVTLTPNYYPVIVETIPQ